VLPDDDLRRGELEEDRPLATAAEYRRAGTGGIGVGGMDVGPTVASGPTDQHPARGGGVDDPGSYRRQTAVVRRDDGVAHPGREVHESLQRLAVEIAGEEQAPSGRLDGEDEARLVVVGR
jgi:hypothetical protein